MPTQILEGTSTRFTKTVRLYLVLEKEGDVWRSLEPVDFRDLTVKYIVEPGRHYVVIVGSGRPDGEVHLEVKEAVLEDGDMFEVRGAEWVMFPERCREASNELLRDIAESISEALFHRPLVLSNNKAYSQAVVDEVFKGGICA